MIGTDENRAVLYVEVIFWSGKRKMPPRLMSGKYCPHFVVTGTMEYLGVCFLDGDECIFDEPALGNAQPLYPDTIDYAPLENNAEFLIYPTMVVALTVRFSKSIAISFSAACGVHMNQVLTPQASILVTVKKSVWAEVGSLASI